MKHFNLCNLLLVGSTMLVSTISKQDSHGTTTAWHNISLITSNPSPWVHFVWMLADNDLDSYGVSDLEEMRLNNATTDELSLVVYVDRCYNCDGEANLVTVNEIYDYYTKESVNGQFTGSKLLQKGIDTNGNHIWWQLYDFGNELDSTLETNIGNFTQLMGQFELDMNNNVEYYALTFWDHGGAWSGYGSDDNTANSTGEQASTLEKLFNAVENGLQETYIGRLDLLGFDACIMADYSVFSSISGNIAHYYLASEVSEPGDGWDYIGLMPVNVTGDGSVVVTNPENYAISIIDSYVHQTDEVTTADYGAGYTLALFDMDKVETFKNEFDSLMKMITMPIQNYDYGMLMSVLRAKSQAIAAEEDFYIYDLGLFLDGLVGGDNVFFETCPTRFQTVGNRVLEFWEDSLLYFDADFLRSDLTGASIFYATNASTLASFTYYNSDLASENYVAFLSAVSDAIKLLKKSDGASLLTNYACDTPIPNNLTFYVSNINIDYNDDYDLYRIRADCGQTVMSAATQVYLHLTVNSSELDIGIASVETQINDVSLNQTELEVFWDGKIALFIDNSTNNASIIFSTSTIEYYFNSDDSKNGVPIGYTIKYPVKLYDMPNNTNEISITKDEYGLFTASNASTGYLEVYVIVDGSNGTWTDADTTATMTLYEINENWGVIGEVSPYSPRVVIGDASFLVDWNYSNSGEYYGNDYLIWPNISVNLINLWNDNNNMNGLKSAVVMEATDVLGNNVAQFVVVKNDTVYSTWVPQTDTNGNSGGTTDTNGKSGGSGSNSSQATGLDAVSSGVWLALVLVLSFILIIVCVMFCRERSLRSKMEINPNAMEPNGYQKFG